MIDEKRRTWTLGKKREQDDVGMGQIETIAMYLDVWYNSNIQYQ